MLNVTLRDVPADLHLWLKQRARAHHRSLNQEVILLLGALRRSADGRLARIRAVTARTAGLPFVDTRSEAQILGLGADGLPS